MYANGNELVKGGSYHIVVFRRAYLANADFEMLVALVSEVEARGCVCLTLQGIFNEVLWFVTEFDRLNVARHAQERRKICGTPVVNDRDSFGIGVRQEVFGDIPTQHAERVAPRQFSPVRSINQECRASTR